MTYELMNQDRLLARFSCSADEFGETKLTDLQWFSETRPLGFSSLKLFLERRQAPKHRKHIAQLLEAAGCDTLEGFLQITHALSLNDTFWVRAEGASLTWDAVSLYRNPFDEVIARSAFDGILSGESLSSTSPEYGTDGRYAKCWIRENNEIFLCKSGSDTYELEPLSEFLATQVAQQICKEPVVYDLAFYHGRLVSKCRLFTSERVGLVKAAALALPDTSVSGLLAYYKAAGWDDAFRRMCILDALILNVDRHLGNFGFLFDTNTMALLGPAPVYDHNRSLLFDLDCDQLQSPEWYLQHCKPRIGVDFLTTARALLTPELRKELESLRDFQFRQHPDIPAEPLRLELLGRIVRGQVEALLQ